ncbi:cell division protein ZapA [Sandarakinorhabdus sp. DWP1-3-1]|uniref:cell division protein ZapA n=1 Tax=Sandarakinorhabdus sp. DWP1-3-1 TaxID=2804627 RepID=UPI003CE6D1ED
MGQVIVDIGGRSYPLSCRDGDEAHLAELAAGIATKADGLTRSLGAMSESRLLLMAALMVADELYDMRRGGPITPSSAVGLDPELAERLLGLADRAEKLADALESSAA